MFNFFSNNKKYTESVFVVNFSDQAIIDGLSVSDMMKDTTVATCIKILSQTIAQLDMVDKENDETTRLLKNPNYINTQFQFMYLIVSSIVLFGEVFIYINRASNNKPSQLMILDNSKVKVKLSSILVPSYDVKDFKDNIKSDDVIHIRDIPAVNADSNSRVVLASKKIKALISANKLMTTSFENGLDIKVLLSTDSSLNKNEREVMDNELKAAFGSSGGSKALIATKTEVTELKGNTPADVDLRELRKHLINEVASIFMVPSFMVGGTSEQKYSNLRQKNTSLYRDTLLPIMTNIQQSFNSKLGGNLEFDINDFIKGDQESQVRVGSQGVSSGILTPNEARVLLGYETVSSDGADDLKEPSAFNSDDMRGSVDEPNELQPENNRGNDNDD